MSGAAFVKSGSPINGPCVVCMTGTDTGFGVMGGTNAVAVVLAQLGLSVARATAMVEDIFGTGARIPVDTVTGIRVCRPCTKNVPYEPDLMVGHSPVNVYDATDIP